MARRRGMTHVAAFFGHISKSEVTLVLYHGNLLEKGVKTRLPSTTSSDKSIGLTIKHWTSDEKGVILELPSTSTFTSVSVTNKLEFHASRASSSVGSMPQLHDRFILTENCERLLATTLNYVKLQTIRMQQR